MDDILASIRRIISDDDALPLSRGARAARQGATPAEPALQPAAQSAPAPVDAFFGLGHRLGRESEANSAVSPPKPRVVEPASPAPVAATAAAPAVALAPESVASEFVARKTPALKLRDFTLKNFIARPVPAREEPAPAINAAPNGAASLPAGESLAEVERPDEPSPSSVVTLPSRNAHANEARLKIAPLTFCGPVFTPSPASPIAPASAVAAAEPAPPVESSPRLAPVPEGVSTSSLAGKLAEPALLSPVSDAKIGASFETLAESLFARNSDLLERATREMLRPMLKAWLDDNLPNVVERLVRAEIERVARGRG